MNKNILLSCVLGVAFLACAFAVNANMDAMKKNINLERYNRLEAERKLDVSLKNTQRLDEQLKDAKRKLQGIQSIVTEGETITNQLKSTAESTSKENESLKATIKQLQEELAASQKAAAANAQAVSAVPVPAPAN